MSAKAHLPILALSATAILTLASCRDDGRVGQLQEEIQSLNDQHNQMLGELNRLKSQLDALGKERDLLKDERTKLDAELESAHKTLNQLQKDFASYRAQYRLSMRERAPGMSLEDFVVDGKSYRKVKVREATEELLAVTHDTGPAKFPWHTLPLTIRRIFGIEEPGEHVMVIYGRSQPSTASVGSDDKFREHSSRILDLQMKIGEIQKDLKTLADEERENRKALSIARDKKLPVVDLQRASNAFTVKRVQLEAELKQLRKKQDDLARLDPRKKRQA